MTTPFERWVATSSACRLVYTTNIPMKISATIHDNAMTAIFLNLDLFKIEMVVVNDTVIAAMIASNLWTFSEKNFGPGNINPLGQSGQDVHDNACLEAVIDLPEIMVLKIRTNEISVSTKILFKCLRNLKKMKDLNLPKTKDPPLVEYLRWSNIPIKISLVIYLFVT